MPGLKREITEETGILPDVGNLIYIQQFVNAGTEQLEFFFHVTNAQDYLHIDPSKTTHGHDEIAEIDFVNPATTDIRPEFLTIEKISAKIDPDDSPKIFNSLK